ncbi:hypothetical protein vBVnaSL3_9 [Vibrio phage vB_VnaS-L3]|nr:hypothetical protein vBVnaSL3_9 [Vibrio phage vB_VnaS-L3]
MDSVGIIVIFVAAITFGLIPTLIASHRKHSNMVAILICNIVGLFTGVFWVVALIWAFTDNTKQKENQN